MMKLKYLYDNRELAVLLLDYWTYDQHHIDVMDQFRISSTAVYPFMTNNEDQLLRFSPIEERTSETIRAELEFIQYLKNEGYPVATIVSSKNENTIEDVNTPWGEYSAVVFKRVSGIRLDKIKLNDNIIYHLGCSLGKLHQLSKRYQPKYYQRVSYQDQLSWMDSVLLSNPNEIMAKKEIEVLRNALTQLEKTEDNFGLIHYDFELDNLFYDKESNCISVIDFDDSVYHWYIMDIEQAIDSICEELSDVKKRNARELFIKGYKSICHIEDALFEKTYIFSRYNELYSYVRCLRAISEPPNYQPDWMLKLQKHIEKLVKKKSKQFGREIF